MLYKIKYSYQTGDSFHQEDQEDILEFEWSKLEIVKEALRRIGEHYKWFQSKESYIEKELPQPKWFNVDADHVTNEKYLINLPLDNGKEVQFFCPWCGYFETLYGAEIVTEDSDMKIEF